MSHSIKNFSFSLSAIATIIILFFSINITLPTELKSFDPVDTILKNSYKNIFSIMQITQQISLLIHNNQVRVPTHKQELLVILRTIQGVLGIILEDEVISSNIKEQDNKLICSANIVNISYEFIKLLEFILDNNFKKIPLNL